MKRQLNLTGMALLAIFVVMFGSILSILFVNGSAQGSAELMSDAAAPAALPDSAGSGR
ncbi:MAG: hypothetical protein QHC90_22815 [Shinella sp.]|nr:hypothetical protein [Shinella sp.]